MSGSIEHIESDPLVGITMGSQSDWSSGMKDAAQHFVNRDITYEAGVHSAHRTPDRMTEYAKTAEQRKIYAIIAGAGGAAHLPGMVQANTALPVVGVPIKSSALGGRDSVDSILQMPSGVPVGMVGINRGKEAAQFVERILRTPHIPPSVGILLRDSAESQVRDEIAKTCELLGIAVLFPSIENVLHQSRNETGNVLITDLAVDDFVYKVQQPIIAVPRIREGETGAGSLERHMRQVENFPVVSTSLSAKEFKNPAFYAAHILATTSRNVRRALGTEHEKMRESVAGKDGHHDQVKAFAAALKKTI